MKIKIVLVVTMLFGLQICAMTDGPGVDTDIAALNQSGESDSSSSTDSESTPTIEQESEPTQSMPTETESESTEESQEPTPVTTQPAPSTQTTKAVGTEPSVPVTTQPAPSTLESVNGTQEVAPTQAAIPTEEAAAPTEEAVAPTEEAAVPTEEAAAPTEEAAAPTEEAAPEEEEQEEGIIDTMEIDDNVNWLEVRKYLQDATVLLEKIGTAYGQVSDMRMQYLQKRNQADKQFDDFMKEAGIDIGELLQKTNDYIQRVQAERTADGDLSEKEREFLDSLTKNKDTLDQLQQDVISLVDLDASIDTILVTAEQQISTSRNYQTQAWQSFQKLETTPQNAEALYAKIDAAYQTVNQLYAYLQSDLLTYFTDTINTLNSQITSIKNEINTLKTAGINLTSGMKDFEAEEKLEDQEAAAARCAEQSAEAVEAALEQARQKREKIESQSWRGRIKAAGLWISDSVTSLFSWITGRSVTSKTTASESAVSGAEVESTTTLQVTDTSMVSGVEESQQVTKNALQVAQDELEQASQEDTKSLTQSILGGIKSAGSWTINSIGSLFSWVKGLVIPAKTEVESLIPEKEIKPTTTFVETPQSSVNTIPAPL